MNENQGGLRGIQVDKKVDKKKNEHSIVSDVSYHDYLVMLCYTDAEWTRRGASDGQDEHELFNRRFGRFTTNCCKYRDAIEDNYRNWFKANNEGKEDASESGKVKRYLYNPMCYVPFGHPDYLSIVLLDDFDPIHYLTADIRTTEEEVCLAFCPKLDDLVGEHERGVFCELHKLLEEGGVSSPKSKDRGETYGPATHGFQESSPLLVFTKYRISGLGALGEGLLFQNALYRAMAGRIKEVTRLLCKEVKPDGKWDGWANGGDVEATKVAFLDLQGPEEVGTLIFCSNYSVALAYVAALRNLTFKDAFGADGAGKLKSSLCRSEMHRTVVEKCLSIRNESPPAGIDMSKENSVPEMLRDEHVFRWTHSSPAFCSESFIKERYSNCNGFVEALSEVQISPGHRVYVEKKIAKTGDGREKRAPAVTGSEKGLYRYEIGTGDYLFSYSAEEGREGFPLVTTKSVWSAVLKDFRMFRPEQGKEGEGRDVVDIETRLSVPVPPLYRRDGRTEENLLMMKRGGKHFSPLSDLLAKTQDKLCYSRREEASGRLSFEKLKGSHKSYGVPISLRRTIEYLYHDFAIIIADPFLFDAALDLYDTFATLHAVLTEHLPERLAKETGSEKNLGFLDGGCVEQLAMLVEAAHNVLAHRIAKAYPESQIRDMAIDFRGGLNQILLSADAVMKCGLGVLRKYVLGGDKQKKDERDIVGALTRVSFRPGARIYSLKFGVERKAQLAFFEVDVPHVWHVASYCDYLHEAFHLIFNRLVLTKAKYKRLDDVMTDRVSEIFAILMTQLFLFGSDAKSSWYHYVESYSKSLTSMGLDDRDTIVRFTELLIWLFFALDAVEGMKKFGLENKPLSWSQQKWHREGKDVEDAVERFKYWVGKAGPFFSRYKELWIDSKGEGGLDAEGYCIAEFRSIYAKVEPIMPRIWELATHIFENYVSSSVAEDDELYKEVNGKIVKMVEEGLRQGAPLIRSQYLGAGQRDGKARGGKDEKELDALFLVCRMLHSYISRIGEAENKEIHLYRRPDNRRVEFGAKERKWHDFQVEMGAATMFCAVPESRRKRLRKQIVILKSLWDISSSLRARRLEIIVSNNV